MPQLDALESRALTANSWHVRIPSALVRQHRRNENTIKKKAEKRDELRTEYELAKLKGGVRGKYAARYRTGTNLVLLSPDVAEYFPDGEVNEVLWGGPAVMDRARLLESPPAKRAKIFEDFLGHQLSNFQLSSASVGNLELYDQTLVLHYKFAVQDYAKVAGNLLIVRPRVLGLKTTDADLREDRKYPVEFPEATIQSDDFTIKIPPGFVADDLPDPADVKSAEVLLHES